MRKNTLLCGALCTALLLLTACGGNSTTPPATDDASQSDTDSQVDNAPTDDAQAPTDTAPRHVEIEVQDYGTIAVELDPSAAPITVENFINLANDGFYDGLTFHRIMSGFMIQGGDPNGNGSGGSEQTIKGEFASNGVENPLSHTRGTISMARTQVADSASSQFFIMHEDNTQLDGEYAAFGHVTSGMEIVDKICEDVQPTDGDGTVPAENQPVITSVKVID